MDVRCPAEGGPRAAALAFCDVDAHVSCGPSSAARSTMGGAFVSLLT